MNPIEERELLETALDALDSLFDSKMSYRDVLTVLSSTRQALTSTKHATELGRAIGALLEIERSALSADAGRERALRDTDALRVYLADLLPP